MVQLVELSAVVDLCYDGVKVLLSPGGRRSRVRVTSTTLQELLTLIKPVSESNNSIGLKAARAVKATLL